MKKRVLAIAATAMATMMMASPVMAQDFKIGKLQSLPAYQETDSG